MRQTKLVFLPALAVFWMLGHELAHSEHENTTMTSLKDSPRRSFTEPAKEDSRPTPVPPEDTPQETKAGGSPRKPNHSNARKASNPSLYQPGNLPAFARRNDVASLESNDSPIKIAKDIRKVSPIDLGRGDIVNARITQDLIGYDEADSPVRAVVTDGPHKGAWLIGNAILDKKTKHILVKFTTFRSRELETKIEGTVHSVTGELGLAGEFVSHYWNYFWAEMLASGVSGYANAMTERKRNVFGFSEVVPSPQSAGAQAVADAASRTSERFAERARNVPEYTVLKGPISVHVFVTKGPTDF